MRIFDVQRSLWVRIGGVVGAGHARLYDYDRRGAVGGDFPFITDECAGIRVKIVFEGTAFSALAPTRGGELHGVVDGLDVAMRDAASTAWCYRLEAIAI